MFEIPPGWLLKCPERTIPERMGRNSKLDTGVDGNYLLGRGSLTLKWGRDVISYLSDHRFRPSLRACP